MCSSKSKLQGNSVELITPPISHINGRPVLQPTCNRFPVLERHNSVKKTSKITLTTPTIQPLSPPKRTITTVSAKISPTASYPKLKSPRQPAVKRINDPHGLNSSNEKVLIPKNATKSVTPVKKSKKSSAGGVVASVDAPALQYSSSMIVDAPGSIAAARREQVAIMQVQRKMRIAHYGRSKSGKYEGEVVPIDGSVIVSVREEKRCSFITSNSDPLYVAYHDEEWGVPVHEDKLLFELLVLTGAQVGSDWTSVLKKRQILREAFSGFDAEIISKFSEKKMTSISADYGIDISQVRGTVDNSNRILEVKSKFGSFNKYLWGFVNHKPIITQYKSCQKMPVKTSKSEAISKDLVRRGFRFVGPTVIHSFMQAAGLTNDHLITCPRHLQCFDLASAVLL